MKHIILLFLIVVSASLKAQVDTTKVLFIGNSFTYFNNMPSIFKQIAEQSGRAIEIASHTPGGISVGDYNQGNQAHSVNPLVYDLIFSNDWDFVIIQDNQGRFVLDSAVFPTSSSNVIGGHLMLRDSIRLNSSCTKTVWFAGWAYRDGYPPYGNTGIEMIERILTNYRVLNDTAKDVISPIGEAWINALNQSSGISLWSSDGAHPSLQGSYLTAVALFSTLFYENPMAYDYNPGIDSLVAQNLRSYAWQAISDSAHYAIYNLGGIHSPDLWLSGNQITTDTYVQYQWFSGLSPLNGETNPYLTPMSNGAYSVLVQDSRGCWLKSCTMDYTLAINPLEKTKGLRIFPNPVSAGYPLELMLDQESEILYWEVRDGYGRLLQREQVNSKRKSIRMDTQQLQSGNYYLRLCAKDFVISKKVVVISAASH